MTQTLNPALNPSERYIANTSGEHEREARSRRFNVIEAFATMSYCLVLLWCVQYPFGVLGKMPVANTITTVLLTLGALYLLFVSPHIHHDTLASWGLGDPVYLWRLLRNGSGMRRTICGVAMAVVWISLAAFAYFQWVKVAEFLFGMSAETAMAMKQSPAGALAVLAFVITVAGAFATCAVRYDNFLSALWTAIKIILVLGTILYTVAFIVGGTKAFADFKPAKFALDVFGYIFWGAIQQLLFSSYFGTRFRKGFAPASNPSSAAKKRFWVSVLNGSFFGLIHINSWFLVLFTWILGIVLSWVFMKDRNRNLLALGFIHGFLGSSVGWLFSAKKLGKSAVSMGVGPTHMNGFDWPTVIVVALLLVGFTAVIAYAARSWREDETA